MSDCLSCGREFKPRKFGHVFCSVGCRHRGERRPEERQPSDEAAVARLFDESRDPEARVRADDWCPGPPEMAALEVRSTVAQRRRWYLNLVRLGRI